MLIKAEDFSLDRTLGSGQSFVWRKIDGDWVSFVGKPVSISQNGDGSLSFEGCSEKEVRDRLGLNDDITGIRAEIDKDDFVDKAITHSGRLRVVKDGLWPATLGFILSIQSNIPLINRRIAVMSNFYGEKGSVNGKDVFSFPTPSQIYDGGLDRLKAFKLGFRTRFVFSAAEYFCKHILSDSTPVDELENSLMEITGVGDKVLDCILLYGIHDLSRFPIDVWISRVVQKHYSDVISGKKKYRDVSRAISSYFGRYAGYAQLFIYDYSRLNSIK